MGKRAYTYDGSDWVGLTSTTADLSNYANMTNTPVSGFRNAIINGGFDINQRNSGTITGPAGVYGLDRWLCVGYESGTNTFAPVSFALGETPEGSYSKRFLRITSSGQSGVNARTEIRQYVESVLSFSGQTITVSFWAKASSGTPKLAVGSWQNFGTGGSPSATVKKAFGYVTLSTTWAKYSLTTTIDSISGKTLGTSGTDNFAIRIFTNAGTTYEEDASYIGVQNAVVDIWGIQVEKGTIATPFEQRPIGTELALCQRYYSFSTGTSGNFHDGYLASPRSDFNEALPVGFSTRMRVAPTVSVSFTNFDNAINGGQFVTQDGFIQYFRCGNSGFPYAGWRATYTASAEL